MLLDLIEARGERGKWFAAAKDAGLLDIAVLCARDFAAKPATLVRAARDFAAKEPKFATEIGMIALERLLNGGGFDPDVALVQQAFGHVMDAHDGSAWIIGPKLSCRRLSSTRGTRAEHTSKSCWLNAWSVAVSSLRLELRPRSVLELEGGAH